MPTAQPSLIGATIGNYRVVSRLGEGGMGTVYLAEHPLIGKRVALKVLHPTLANDPEVVTRFFNEARAVNEIGHPNIVDVLDYGVLEPTGGPSVVYFIMELLTGEPLRASLLREAPLPVDRAVQIAIQIGDALAASHEKGVIHRDLKPDNVFLTQRGRELDFVKVLDFGIAKLSGGPGGGGDLARTRPGTVMGTPAYMSPEQCEGKRGLDARADVYALGVLLYEMITGRVPFTGEGYGEVIMQHMTEPPVPPRALRGDIPAAIEAVVMKALEKRRDRRFGSMERMVAALRDPEAFVASPAAYSAAPSRGAVTVPERKARIPEAFTATIDSRGGAPPSTTLSSSVAELRPPAMRSRAPVILTSAVVVLAALGGGAFLLLREPPGDDEGPYAAGAVSEAELAPLPVPVPLPPPPPKPAPTPAVMPAAAASITLTITSVPPGAEVLVGEEPRGTTPLVLQLPRGEGKLELLLRLEGYKDKRRTVRASRDTELEVMLVKDRRARRRAAEQPASEPTPARPAEEILPLSF